MCSVLVQKEGGLCVPLSRYDRKGKCVVRRADEVVHRVQPLRPTITKLEIVSELECALNRSV